MKNIFLIIKRIFSVLLKNPAFFAKRCVSSVREKIIPVPKSGVYKFSDVAFDFDFSFSHKIKKMYFGTFQPIISEILKKYLKPGDTFIDVGANVGYFSFVAIQIVGKGGQAHAFEPVKEYFDKLELFFKINKDYKIFVNKMALGEKNQNLDIFIKGGSDIGNNTFFPELLGSNNPNKESVQVIRLDEYIKQKNVKNIKLIKIDVEGFEFAALKGLSGYFSECSKNNSFPVIVCEVVPEAYAKFGARVEDLFSFMAGYNYYPYDVLSTKRKVKIEELKRGRLSDILFKQEK